MNNKKMIKKNITIYVKRYLPISAVKMIAFVFWILKKIFI